MQDPRRNLRAGQKAIDAGDVAAAARNWQLAIDEAGGDVASLLTVIRFHLRHGRRGEVIRAYKKLASVSPQAAESAPFDPRFKSLSLRARDGIRSFWANMTKPDRSFEDHLERGQLMKIVGDFQEAENAFRLALSNSPKGDNRAEVQLQLLRPWDDSISLPSAEALRFFAIAWQKDLKSEDQGRLGGLNGQLTMGRIARFHKPLKHLVCDVLLYEGTLLMRLHFLYEIGRNYCEAISMPADFIPWMQLIHKSVEGRELMGDARSIFLAIIHLDSRYVHAWHNLGIVEMALGNLDEAERLLQNAVVINPGIEPFVELRLADIAERKGDIARAADLYQKATAVFKEIGVYHRNAGRCLRAVGRIEEALHHYGMAMHWNRWHGPEYTVNPLATPPADFDPFKYSSLS